MKCWYHTTILHNLTNQKTLTQNITAVKAPKLTLHQDLEGHCNREYNLNGSLHTTMTSYT